MVRQVGHSDGYETIIRANRTLLLGLLWERCSPALRRRRSDVGRWVNLW
jgi:hypothetical protein